MDRHSKVIYLVPLLIFFREFREYDLCSGIRFDGIELPHPTVFGLISRFVSDSQ